MHLFVPAHPLEENTNESLQVSEKSSSDEIFLTRYVIS